jgi:hypothetical protein
MVKTTRAQREALLRIWRRWYPVGVFSYPQNAPTYREFRKRVMPGSDCVMVQVPGMWLGIETDGYTHS